MERSKKKELLGEMNATFSGAGIVIISRYKGLTVAQADELRGKVRKAGAKIKVTKNRITKLALEGTAYGQLANMFKGTVMVATANEPVAVSKALAEFAKDREDNFVIVGGALGDRVLSVKEIQALATLPSMDELRAKLIGMLQTPATRIASILQAPGGQVARVISAHASKG